MQSQNIMSGIFSHAIRYEFADRNPITAVRQSGKREKVPVLLDVAELHRLFDDLDLRERAMIVCDALTGMRRSELLGLQWCDLDFFEMRINIVRSMVDQVIGNCRPKHRASRLSWMSTLRKCSKHGGRKACTPLPPIGSGPHHRRRVGSHSGWPPLCGTTSSRQQAGPALPRRSAGTPSGTRSRL